MTKCKCTVMFSIHSCVCVCVCVCVCPVLDCPTLQSSRSLDTLSDLKLQRLEAELEGVRHEAQGACQREEELKTECERMQEELRQLQNNQRGRVSIEHTRTHMHKT